MSFRIQSATLEAEIAAFSGGGGQPNFDPLAEAHLDVSTDGIDWTTVGTHRAQIAYQDPHELARVVNEVLS